MVLEELLQVRLRVAKGKLDDEVSCLDPKRSTRGNRRVSLSGFQFSRLHPRTHKAYDSLTHLEINLLPKV